MAIRKKSEIIHLRVEPQSKFILEGLANLGGTTATRVIERLLLEASEIAQVMDIEESIDDSILADGKLTLREAIDLALVDKDQIITKLRISYLANDALSVADKFITLAIISSLDIFGGEIEIFARSENIIKEEDFNSIPRVDVEKIHEHMKSLTKFAEFRVKNPNIFMSYKEYLRVAQD